MGQSAILAYLKRLEEQNKRQAAAIEALGKGLVFVAQRAGLEAHLAKIVHADVENPAQPVPQPGGEAPVQSTEDALAGDSANPVSRSAPAGGNPIDLSTPGTVPGSTDNVPADATTSVDAIGTVLDVPAFQENQDVTQPVTGTTEALPIDQVKTEVEVVAPAPTTEVAYPLDGGPFSQPMSTSGNARFIASLRLARLRIGAGIASGEDVGIAQAIAASDVSDDAIAREVMTLESVKAASVPLGGPTAAARRVAPHTAARTTPSLAPTGDEAIATVPMSVTAAVVDDEVAFERRP